MTSKGLIEEEMRKRGVVGNIFKRMEPFIKVGLFKEEERNKKDQTR